MDPIVSPRPSNDDSLYLKGLLEGIAKVEKRGYDLLMELGVMPALSRIRTAGGGAKNEKWTSIRRRIMGLKDIDVSDNMEAAYGAALIAKRALSRK